MGMKILIDNGHGSNTAGKRSPDGRLLEYRYAREIADDVVAILRSYGYDAEKLVPEERDISLSECIRRVNTICNKLGAGNVILISIHCNAAGNGTWLNARGWCAFTTVGKTKSDGLAECLYDAAEMNLKDYSGTFTKDELSTKQRPIRTDLTDGDRDLEKDFYIIKKSACPAVLTENMFQDNRKDVDWLLSDAGYHAITRIHVEGIIKYIQKTTGKK